MEEQPKVYYARYNREYMVGFTIIKAKDENEADSKFRDYVLNNNYLFEDSEDEILESYYIKEIEDYIEEIGNGDY